MSKKRYGLYFHLSLTKLFMQTNPGVPDWDSSGMPVFVPDLLQVNKNHGANTLSIDYWLQIQG